MALLANNLGEKEMLKRIIGSAGDTLWLRLYDNNVVPAEGDTYGTYSESGGTGYGEINLRGDSWTITTEVGDTTHADYAQQTFTYTAGDTLYGYYLVAKTADAEYGGDTVILISERFTGAPFVIPGGGGSVKISPKIQME